MNKKIVLDTETTGFNKVGIIYKNHNIIEIGLVEISNENNIINTFQQYIKPKRPVTLEAYTVHGISTKFLQDKPPFNKIVKELFTYIYKNDVIIHNAPFDVGFLNYELSLLKKSLPKIENICNIIDTLKIARYKFPGKKNTLDALAERFNIKKDRKLHGALLDAKILAEIYPHLLKETKNIKINNKSNIFFTP